MGKMQTADVIEARDVKLLEELQTECENVHMCQLCDEHTESNPILTEREPRIPLDGIHFDIPPQEKDCIPKRFKQL